MQNPVPLLAVLLLLLAAGNAAAQVTIDRRALDQLQPPPKTPASQGQPSAKAPSAQHPDPSAPTATATVRPQPPVPAAPASPLVPLAPPSPSVIPPAVAVPVRPAPPPLPPVVAADAPGAATSLPAGLRVTFGADRADLNPATDAALRALVRAATAPGTTFTVTSYAAGMPDDASTARRLSLSRALTVRSVLINEGIASIRIYVKALGAAAPTIADGPADRADIVVGGTPSQTSAEAPSQPKPTP